MHYLLSFPNELARLYAVTKNRTVEDCFIKIAQSFDGEFLTWINDKEASKISQSTDVREALKFLAAMRQKYPSKITSTDFIKEIVGTPKISLFPTIISLSGMMGHQIVAIFSDIIVAATSHIGGAPTVNVGAIQNDLKLLHDGFRLHMERALNHEYDDTEPSKPKGRITKKSKMISLFSYLLKEFSTELAQAYKEIGKNDIANGLMKGNLANPAQIQSDLRIENPLRLIMIKAPIIFKEAMKIDPENVDAVYNYIRNAAFNVGGEITSEQIKQQQLNGLKSVDFSDFMGDGALEKSDISPKMEKIPLDANGSTNYVAVMIISNVLYMLYDKISR